MSLKSRIYNLRESIGRRIASKYLLPLFFAAIVMQFLDLLFFGGVMQKVLLGLFAFAVALIVFFVQSKSKYYFPFIGLSSFLLFHSFWNQDFSLGVNLTLPYYIGFGIFFGSAVNAVIKEKYTVFWLALLAVIAASAIPLTLRIPIGDERGHLQNLGALETGLYKPSDFGAGNYVNVSFVYFYYLAIIAKLLGTSVIEVFFALKLLFVLLIFIGIYLIASLLSDRRTGLLAALIAFFPLMNLHFAPQMIGKYGLLMVFLYIYLKYLKSNSSRILLILLMVLLVYINLTTLYLSLILFGFFVWFYFFFGVIKKKMYLIDLVTLGLFVLLVFTYLTSINLLEVSSERIPGFQQEQPVMAEGTITAEPVSGEQIVRAKAIVIEPPKKQEVAVISEESLRNFSAPLIYIIPSSRIRDFISSYIAVFGFRQFYHRLVYYLFVLVILLLFFFLEKSNYKNVLIYSLAVIMLAGGLLVIRFQEGVHATLEMLTLSFSVCLIALFKRSFLLIFLILFMLVGYTGISYYANNYYGESSVELGQYLSNEKFLGQNLIVVNESENIIKVNPASDYIVPCSYGKPKEIYFDYLLIRCDDMARIGGIGKLVYRNEQVNAYLIRSADLARMQP
ncbi:MAG: hypothetical protein AB1467_06190 [Candidatus Diapherotrites archaeon]